MYKSRVGLTISLLSSSTLATTRGLRPALFLNFLSGSLDSRVGFSRGTNATMVDSTGRIVYAPANLLLRSEEFDNAAWTKSNATVTANVAVAPDGTSTADRLIPTAAATDGRIIQAFTGSAGATYTLSVYGKADAFSNIRLYSDDSGSNSASVSYNLATGVVSTAASTNGTWASVSSTIADAGNGWYRVTLTWTATGSAPTRVAIWCRDTGNGTSGIFVWGAQLEPVTYQTAPGPYVATTASAYYGPRFDYNPFTLGALGLLIEEQRTNLLLRSQEFDQSPWSATRATVSANVTAAPDGTATADKLVEDTTATSSHFISQSFASHTSGVSYTLTVYAKAAERSQIRINGDAAIGLSAPAVFNLSDGSVVAAGSFTATISNAGNGWYRCVCTGVATATGTGVWVIGLAVAGNTTYTGDGTSGIFIWGAQLEVGAFATSYIPTVASQVTRNADVASMTGTNFSGWYNQTEGTLVAEFSFLPRVLSGTNPIVYNGSTSGRWAYATGASVRMFDGTNFAVAGTIASPSDVSKTASALSSAGMAMSLNGSAPGTAPYVGAFGTQNALDIGNGGSVYLNGHIRQIAYFNTRLPDAQLQTLSSPSLVPTLVLDFTASSYASGY